MIGDRFKVPMGYLSSSQTNFDVFSKEIEFKRKIDLLLELGVIRPSRAGYYSHGFMVPKPGDEMAS